MAYNDNEYKSDSPKKTTAKKEELIVPPNFISTPEQNTQQQLIKQIEAEALEAKLIVPEVLSSKRSAFLNSGVKQRLGGGGNCIVAWMAGSNNTIKWKNLSNPAPTTFTITAQQIENAVFAATGENPPGSQTWQFRTTIGMFGDKVYLIMFQTPNWHKPILELRINFTNNTVISAAIYMTDMTNWWDAPTNLYQTPGMCATNATTLHFGSWVASLTPGSPVGTYSWSWSTLYVGGGFPSPEVCEPGQIMDDGVPLTPMNGLFDGDIVYIPSDDTFIVSTMGIRGNTDKLYHCESNGTIIDSLTHTISEFGNGLYCVDGNIYSRSDNNIRHLITTYPLAITLESTISFPPINSGEDLASDPNCCGGSGASTGCYNIGDIGPEGGIIFAVPLGHPQNNGVNQTNFYYEVAQDDIAIGGTPSTGFNSMCGGVMPVQLAPVVDNLVYDNYYVPGVWPTQPQVYITGAGASLPIVDLFNNFSPVRVEWFACDGACVGGPLFGDPNYGWTSHLPPGTTLTNILQNNSGTQNVFEFSNSFTNLANYPAPWGPIPPNPHFPIHGYARFTGTPPITPPSPSGWSLTGAEWGVHNKPNITTSTDFGTGHINTDAIDAYPLLPGNPTGGINPWLDSHDIAATLCKQTEGWFLPSRDEFMEMIDASNTYGFPLGLNVPPGLHMEHAYWTSSQYRQDPTNPIQDPHKYSWSVWNVGAGIPMLAYRCHALSVRPIRRFECDPEPPPRPCTGCDCIEYNWRDCIWNNSVGHLGSTCGDTLPASGIWDNTFQDSCMGGNDLWIRMGATDVMGNEWTIADWQDDSIGYIITIWDKWYNYLGKWKFDNFGPSPTFQAVYPTITGEGQMTALSMGNNPSVYHPLLPDSLDFFVSGVTHLDGPSPLIDYNIGPNGQSLNSCTGTFWKIEAACNVNLPTAFENGCNHLFGVHDFPAVCLDDNAPAGFDSSLLPWFPFPCNYSYGTYSPPNYYQDGSLCWSSCVPPITNHCWSICGVEVSGTWYAVPDPWFNGQPYGPMAMENNPLGTTPPPFSSNPYIDQDFTDFYNWMLTQTPTLAIGDSFIFQITGYSMQFNFVDASGGTSTSSLVTKICFKYRGVHNYVQPLGIINDGNPLPTITMSNCCVSGGSSSSLTRPTENNPDSIKINVDKTFSPSAFKGLSSKRIEFLSEAGELDDFMVQNNIGPTLTLPTEELPSIQFNDALPPIDILPLKEIQGIK